MGIRCRCGIHRWRHIGYALFGRTLDECTRCGTGRLDHGTVITSEFVELLKDLGGKYQ